MHFMGGVIIPRQVLCPWRAHLLASTLPAVARATAACFVRREWVVGRGVGLLRGSSSGWCVSGARQDARAWSLVEAGATMQTFDIVYLHVTHTYHTDTHTIIQTNKRELPLAPSR